MRQPARIREPWRLCSPCDLDFRGGPCRTCVYGCFRDRASGLDIEHARWVHLLSGAANGLDDAGITAAAAEMPVHRRANLCFGGLRSFREQRCRGDNHSVEAISPLHGLFFNDGFLHRVQSGCVREFSLARVPGGQSFERGDGLALDRGNRRHAGANFFAVEEHGTRSALREAASEAWALQMKLVGKHVQQGRIGRGGNSGEAFVYADLERAVHGAPPSWADVATERLSRRAREGPRTRGRFRRTAPKYSQVLVVG